LEYEIYAFDLSVRCAYLTNQRAFFNGSSVFLQPVGFENNTCEVQINYPTDEVLLYWLLRLRINSYQTEYCHQKKL
jgi:predicted metalloprotease with PDZ domain